MTRSEAVGCGLFWVECPRPLTRSLALTVAGCLSGRKATDPDLPPSRDGFRSNPRTGLGPKENPGPTLARSEAPGQDWGNRLPYPR